MSDGWTVNFVVSFFRFLVKTTLGAILLLYVVFVILMYSSPAARELMIYLHPCKCIEGCLTATWLAQLVECSDCCAGGSGFEPQTHGLKISEENVLPSVQR